MSKLEELQNEINNFKELKMEKKRNTWTPNDIIVYDKYAEVVLRDNKQNINGISKISIGDLKLVRRYKWCKHKNGYVSGKHNGKTIMLHRLLYKFPNDIVDHINRNKLDNRRVNLRLTTTKGNNNNKSDVSERGGSVFFVRKPFKENVEITSENNLSDEREVE